MGRVFAVDAENVLETDADGSHIAQLIYLMPLKCALKWLKFHILWV